ncbi:MAG: dUTP diphosphatase [Bacteroidia bacterium]|nr:dUTP diphosphatase [Bacteroidia bacterium]MBN4052246.1 dUTP diphosphatase [Sphingobacteriaceae bacterium AH-315-L07]
MEIKVINKSNHPLPEYKTEFSAGMDLNANIESAINLKPLERALITTGLFIELPIGYEAQIRPRSGIAFKKGITVLNSPGTIDADYRGEVKVLVVNLSNGEVIIENGERIAQMIIAKHETITWVDSEILSDTSRGSGGYGSTGVK